MSLGKPVVGHLREDLLACYPWKPPIVAADPSTIYEKLKELILHPALRAEIGAQARAFVEKYHDLQPVTEQLLGIYKEIGQEG
jgi:glycosyltransferase involved in cell wall biosynthesis